MVYVFLEVRQLDQWDLLKELRSNSCELGCKEPTASLAMLTVMGFCSEGFAALSRSKATV